MFVDIDLDETHLTKVIADFAGHYMRPDLIRLLVDTRRKELVTEADPDGGIATYSTAHRLGLDRPLDGERRRPASEAVGVAGRQGQGKQSGSQKVIGGEL